MAVKALAQQIVTDERMLLRFNPTGTTLRSLKLERFIGYGEVQDFVFLMVRSNYLNFEDFISDKQTITFLR